MLIFGERVAKTAAKSSSINLNVVQSGHAGIAGMATHLTWAGMGASCSLRLGSRDFM